MESLGGQDNRLAAKTGTVSHSVLGPSLLTPLRPRAPLAMVPVPHIPPVPLGAIPVAMQLAARSPITHLPLLLRLHCTLPVGPHPVVTLPAPDPPSRHEHIIGTLAHPVSLLPRPPRIAAHPVPRDPGIAWLRPHGDDPARWRRRRRADDQSRAPPRGRPASTRQGGRRGHGCHEYSRMKPFFGDVHVFLVPPRPGRSARPTPADMISGSAIEPAPASRCATAWQPCIRAAAPPPGQHVRYTCFSAPARAGGDSLDMAAYRVGICGL